MVVESEPPPFALDLLDLADEGAAFLLLLAFFAAIVNSDCLRGVVSDL